MCTPAALRDLSARQDHGRRGDGVGLPAAPVPRGRDRRRALLGRRLPRQSRRSFRSSARPRPRTCWWCRSIRWSARRRRRRRSEIVNRINEITFNSSLLAEFRAIEFVARLIDQGRLPRGIGPGRIPPHQRAPHRARPLRHALRRRQQALHRLRFLRDAARRRRAPARRFLDEHFDDIGVRSTVDLRAEAQAEWA